MSEVKSSTEIEYRQVFGFPGYRVGSDGSVWTVKAKGGNDRTPGKLSSQWKLLSIAIDRHGYHRVALCHDGKTITRMIHRLVLEAFVGPRPIGKEACHYPDFNKANNRLENLRWDTHAENERDEYRDRLPVVTKLCARCLKEKPVLEFYGDKRSSDGLKSECKHCHCIIATTTRDKDAQRKRNREYMRRKRASCKVA